MVKQLLFHFYRALLYLYPRGFRSEFGAEMLEVFCASLADAARNQRGALPAIYLRELGELPGAALGEHYRRWRRKVQQTADTPGLWARPLSSNELLAAMAIFAVPAVMILLNTAPASPLSAAIPLEIGFVALMFFTGMSRGFPRWALPYLGMALAIISFIFLGQWLANLSAPVFMTQLNLPVQSESARLLLHSLWAGLMWLSLFALVTLVVAVLAIWRRFRQFYWRLRQDWTLVSFVIYGGTLFALVLLFDEYRYEEPYALLSLLCLATGAWHYLRNPHPWQRTLALLSGATLAMWVAAAGIWLIVPAQPWESWFQWHPAERERWFEAGKALVEWAWIVVALLAPALLALKRPDSNTPQTS